MLEVSRLDLFEKLGNSTELRRENLARQSGGQGQNPEGTSPPMDRQVSFDLTGSKFSAAGQPNYCTLAKLRVCNGTDDWCTPARLAAVAQTDQLGGL